MKNNYKVGGKYINEYSCHEWVKFGMHYHRTSVLSFRLKKERKTKKKIISIREKKTYSLVINFHWQYKYTEPKLSRNFREKKLINELTKKNNRLF